MYSRSCPAPVVGGFAISMRTAGSDREKVGAKVPQFELYRKRKTEVMQGKKLPENSTKDSSSFLRVSGGCSSNTRRLTS